MSEKRMLLHICCAPCAIYPLKVLREKGFDVEGIFFNPNIHPIREFITRQQSVAQLASIMDLPVYYPQYRPEFFFRSVKADKYSDRRCGICWDLRLKETASFASENEFSHFSSTLLVSPYQNIGSIKEIGESFSSGDNARFYFEDFRSGFSSAQEEAKGLGLYSQKYCGCLYSQEERSKKK